MVFDGLKVNLASSWVFCRDVSSVELLMNNHQGIKAEIDARNDSFTACIELGKSLLARKHYASEEVRETSARSKYGNTMEWCLVSLDFSVLRTAHS